MAGAQAHFKVHHGVFLLGASTSLQPEESSAAAYTSSFCVMSHLSGNTFDNDSDEEPYIESVAIPGPNTSKGDLMEALKALQVQLQKLVKDNCTLCEENKTLVAEKPKRKCRAEAPDELLAHEQTITLFTRKYSLTVEMFPNSDLLSKPRPKNPTPFNSCDWYLTAMMQESAFLDELFQHFPNCIHSAMQSLYFSDLVMKSISEARSSEINKLHGVAGDIFGLPGMYFANTNYRRADVAEIRDMLGVSAANPKYKTFPLVLFLGMQEDSSLKTIFRNWELLAKVLKATLHGVTSLHQETTSGPKMNARKWNFKQVTPGSIAWAAIICCSVDITEVWLKKVIQYNYKDLFYHYKKLLLTKWDSRCIQTIVQNINREVFGSAKSSASGPAGQEDHSSEIIRAMNALDMDSDSESDLDLPGPAPGPSSTAQATTASRQSDVFEVAQPPEDFAPPFSAISTLSTASALSSASRKHAEVPVMTGPEATNTNTPVVVQDSDGVGQQPTQGRGKKKLPAAAEGVCRGARRTC
ncbi:uncharacterized protein EDB93DRAFT_1100999 [Suillus bovinus]|uniref:uncharacterized protein n=1 Tax=Suillus bovinus TaxID=48563 RepID=UPI001B86B5C9|nr:uncharacterized protein EDB93DRAFT_1100999 [Suillus bovinus]KAG2157657.1 hypothetical protein EDB93DRAFT_1100999 [Suillus bovinus]